MEKIPYIVKKRMRLEGIGGHVNLPYGTRLEAVDGMIIHKGAAVCAVTSRFLSTPSARRATPRASG